MTTEKKNAADMLVEIAGIYRERKPMYGDNYKHVGKIMLGMFPNGLTTDDEETWNRLHLIFHMVGKLTRYAQNIKKGGHQDSLDDLAVYAMLSRECDEEWAAKWPEWKEVDTTVVHTDKVKGTLEVEIALLGGGTAVFSQNDLAKINERRSSAMSFEMAASQLSLGVFDDLEHAIRWLEMDHGD